MVHVDVDPESMLSAQEDVRVQHNATKERMSLYDMMFIGITFDEHENGVFNPESIARIKQITDYATTLEGVVSHEILSLDNVDAIEPGGLGEVKFSRVMSKLPQTQQEVIEISKRSINNPFLRATQISKDGKAVAIYIPLKSKDVSWGVSNSIKTKIAELGGPETYHIAGLPLAEDQFGVEMFIQMAISAPAAMLLIGILIWAFFRQVNLTLGSLLIAMSSVIITMGMFIAFGNTLHIMSSMIPIFIMPIAVLDSVHVISHFYDKYEGDRAQAIKETMHDLWTPMLYTSITTSVGFASLYLAPIPPIQMFGLYTGIGIMIAWLLTMTLLPAYIMTLPERALNDFGAKKAKAKKTQQEKTTDVLAFVLHAFEKLARNSRHLVLLGAITMLCIAGYGISTLVVNDNPTKWFESEHEIRKADLLVNERFAGSYMLYLTMDLTEQYDIASLLKSADEKLKDSGTEGRLLHAYMAKRSQEVTSVVAIINDSRSWISEQIEKSQGLPDSQNDAAGDGLDFMMEDEDESNTDEMRRWMALDNFLDSKLHDFQIAKNPEFLRWTEQLLNNVENLELVGKGQGPADLVKKVNRELHSGNEKYSNIPNSSAEVMETYVSFQNSHDLPRLWHIITNDYTSVTLAIQLTSGDNIDVTKAVEQVGTWVASNPSPQAVAMQWSDLSFINTVWQEKMVNGMLQALLGSGVIVFIMMAFLFRSLWWGLLSLFPLGIAISFVYGLTGLMGKDYDMPIAIISSLALGLSIDFAIHLMAHVREFEKKDNVTPEQAIILVFGEPSKSIARNAVVIALGFSPLLLAPLVPYQTVGWLMMSIMVSSALATFLVLPAMMHYAPIQRLLFGNPDISPEPVKVIK